MMYLTDFPYQSCQAATWAKDLDMGNIKDKKNPFKWDKVVNNLPGTSTYDYCRPWVYKERINRSIFDVLFFNVNYGRPIGPT